MQETAESKTDSFNLKQHYVEIVFLCHFVPQFCEHRAQVCNSLLGVM